MLSAAYFLGEASAAAGWEGRPYRWTVDAISELGVPETRSRAGEQFTSTRSALMNATFIGSGVRAALAGLLLAPFVPGRGRWVVLPLVVAYVLGLLIVGVFPTATVGVRATMHGIGALLAVVGGGILLLAIAIAFWRRHPALATFTGVCAAVSILGSVLAVWGSTNFGLYERIAANTVVVWQVVTGVVVLVTAPPGPSLDVRQGE